MVQAVCSDRKRWVDFMMKFELGLEEPEPKRAGRSALTIAASYITGGLIPLAPYFFLPSIHTALIVSVIVTLLAHDGLWLRQRAVHREAADPERLADRRGRRAGGCGRIRVGEDRGVIYSGRTRILAAISRLRLIGRSSTSTVTMPAEGWFARTVPLTPTINPPSRR